MNRKRIVLLVVLILFLAGLVLFLVSGNNKKSEQSLNSIKATNLEKSSSLKEVNNIKNNLPNNIPGQNNGPLNIANPASTNCKIKGGRLEIEKKPDGGEYGLCFFDDNRACEEWAMFRNECPLGGVKTTGYDTEAQKFCAWSGGKTSAVENAVCTFSDKSTCLAEDFYKGACHKGERKNIPPFVK
ncbi:MAG: DUF333 domain-containing protein [Planctomycetes bacterium]|jgi:hypothetical protein|nr:DUF333 domain-containing protein [Planctomycetota bacterium]